MIKFSFVSVEFLCKLLNKYSIELHVLNSLLYVGNTGLMFCKLRLIQNILNGVVVSRHK